ncbi:hypothetical protein [Paenibacillus ihumii]|uniref:hypothetical protein n=1 Tax=Paenibacillus ihumii TaxID=687436 RepID=UPI000B0093CD|nr:hypothetical protein [Paenibacillus ihumii]
MKFTYTEIDGDQPAYEWLAAKVKEYAKSQYGMELDIVVLPDSKIKKSNKEEETSA